MKVLSANNRTLPLKNLEHHLPIVLSTKLFVLFSFLTLSFMIFQLFSPIVSSNAETENTAKVSTPAGTISLATEDNVTINITPTPTQKIYSKTTALKITNSCKKGATITLSTNKTHNNLERQGADTLTKTIASITTTGNLTDNSWGYTLDNTNYSKVPTKDQSPATIYNTNTATTSTTTPENLNLTYAVKTDDTIPSGTYTNDLVYTVNVKPECLQYTLKFNLDNGTGKPGAVYTNRQLSYGTKVNLSDFTPTRTDYEFIGWIATTNNPATTLVTFTGNSNIDVNPANDTEVTLKAKWRYAKGLYSISNMQQMNPNICRANTTPLATATTLDTDGSHAGDPDYVPTKTLTDTRDNNTYTVSKLADGKCWMTQNLRIAGKTLTPADSDVTANYTIPASSINGFSSNNTSNAYIDNTYGGYYSWYTATAGTGTYSMSSGKTLASICPKGWRLPTGGRGKSEYNDLYEKYNSSSMLTSSPVNMNMAGYIAYGGFGQYGTYSRYWASTAYSQDYANLTYMDATSADLGTYDSKNRGITVRCIADNPTIHSIFTMQQMTSDICFNTTIPNRTATTLDTDGSHHGDPNYVPTVTLTDTRDNNTYTVSKLADGKCWMTQNLRIGNMNIDSANSDVSSSYTVQPYHIDSTHGGYYSWYVATAGSGSGTGGGQNAAYSICPKGWRLPIGGSGNTNERWGLYSKYPSFTAMTSSPVNINLGGTYGSYGSSLYGAGTRANYWAATNYDNGGLDRADNLGLENGNVYYEPASNKHNGFSIRCIAR